ncbi:MAG: hypothetical protein ILP09_04820 [Oscillospiraceae bacterium]|nr:hypothetical protein [Oscillospiraceae bacterium]
MPKEKIFIFLKTLGVSAAAVLLVIFPRESSAAACDALSLCLTRLIPSMFPFFVLSPMLRLPERPFRFLTEKVFKVNGGCASAYLIGLLGGYPVGAAAAAELYSGGGCSRDEAERLLAFCCCASPSFAFGFLSADVLQSVPHTVLLYAVHLFASALTGFLFGVGHVPSAAVSHAAPAISGFTSCVKKAVVSMASVCAFVIFTSVYIRLLPLRSPLAAGLFEITTGLSMFSGASPVSLCSAAFLLGWGGISVHCQVMSFTSQSGLSAKRYFLARASSGLLGALIMLIICKIMWK